jgi:hypothetical protein
VEVGVASATAVGELDGLAVGSNGVSVAGTERVGVTVSSGAVGLSVGVDVATGVSGVSVMVGVSLGVSVLVAAGVAGGTGSSMMTALASPILTRPSPLTSALSQMLGPPKMIASTAATSASSTC